MKKILVMIAVLAIPFPVSAALKVYACEPEWAALVQELGGKDVTVEAATTALQDVHHIEARPGLIAKVRRADLLICTGADLESAWLPLVQRQAANARVQPGQPGYFAAADVVAKLDVPTSVDRALGDIHPYGNPHVHMDPRRIAEIAAALAQRLALIDPANAEHYSTRHADFAARWQQAIRRWQGRATPLKGTKVVVHHKGWEYLFDWLQMVEVGTIEPKPGLPPSAAHLAELKARLLAQPARMIVRAAYQEVKPSDWLAKQTGIPALELPYTVGGTPAAKDLFGLFDDTIERLLQAGTP